MNYHIDAESAIVNIGNLTSIKKLMRRAIEGEDITLGFIGGSITQGSLSSTPEKCYAYLVYQWWKNTFPKSRIIYINAGIGGTTSQFGVARVSSDLLTYQPDFVLVEFSVNDDNNAHFLETFEGLIRTMIYAPHAPAVIIVNNVRYDNGINAAEQHNLIGKAYEIPCIDMKKGIYPFICSREIKVEDISPDSLHPNDHGHELVSSIINHFLEKVLWEVKYSKDSACDRIRKEGISYLVKIKPITLNSYEHSIRYQNNSKVYVTNGFIPDNSVQETITQCFRHGWYASQTGASIIFEIEGTCISVQFRKTIHKPAPIAVAIVDDDIENPIILDGNFSEDWGDCLYLQTLIEHKEYKKHKIYITIRNDYESVKTPFYLVSVIGSY